MEDITNWPAISAQLWKEQWKQFKTASVLTSNVSTQKEEDVKRKQHWRGEHSWLRTEQQVDAEKGKQLEAIDKNKQEEEQRKSAQTEELTGTAIVHLLYPQLCFSKAKPSVKDTMVQYYWGTAFGLPI